MNTKRSSLRSAAPYFCLFVSGAASLVYELAWIRQLTLVFGGTLYAISAVLCAFMSGLALGAWACSRYLNRKGDHHHTFHLVRLYGVIEGLIGIYGLLFPFGLELLSRLYPLALGGAVESGPLLHFLEFFLSALLMLPATSLMGATLPIIGSWAIGGRASRIFSGVSVLYSLNTFGAVFGCLFAQLFAIKYLGVQAAIFSAVAMNFIVFLICFPMKEAADSELPETLPPFAREIDPGEESGGEPPQVKVANGNSPKDIVSGPGADPFVPEPVLSLTKERAGGEPVPSRLFSYLLLFIFTYSGMASLSSEILWTRVLVFPMGSTLYSFTLILATFLFSIALGSLIAEKLLGNSRWILKFLLIELAIGVICIAVLPLFDRLADWTLMADRLFYDLESSAAKTLFVRSLFAFGLMFLPTLGFGLIFPLANRIHLSLFGTVSRTLGNSYAINTVGSVMGTVLTPFVFIPLFGIRASVFIIYSVLILLTAWGLLLYRGFRPARLAMAGIAAAALISGGYAWSTPGVATDRVGDHNLARTEINVPKNRMRLLDYKEGDFSTLSVVEDKESGVRTIYMDGFSTATVSRSFGASSYMQAMGFVPMALHPDPKKALVIGFGTGNTLGTVSLFPDAEVDGVEIDRNVLSMARWFSEWNHDAVSRPNVRMTVTDGRTFVRWTNNLYDVITLEPMSPVQAGVVNLYSREFYELGLKKLNEGGLMMQWVPLHLVGPEDARAIIKTFQEVFPHTSVWNSFLTRIVLVVGSRQPVTLEKSRFDQLMNVPALQQSARQMGINTFLDFADFFITDGTFLKEGLKDAAVITDNLPILEHSPATLLPPQQWETDQSFINLLRYRVGQSPPLSGVSEEEKAGLNRDYDIRTAQRLAVFSRRYHGPGEGALAARNYLAGLEQMKIYLDTINNAPISLKDARWDGG